MSWLFNLYSLITGKNHKNTPPDVIRTQLTEKRALPVGLAEFHEWSERIIAGAMLPATVETQKYTLANFLLNLKPTTAFEEDIYFIHCLRKTACNQVADYYRKEVYAKKLEKMAAEAAEKQNSAEVTAPMGADVKVLEVKRV
jgi:hypothetical protein